MNLLAHAYTVYKHQQAQAFSLPISVALCVWIFLTVLLVNFNSHDVLSFSCLLRLCSVKVFTYKWLQQCKLQHCPLYICTSHHHIAYEKAESLQLNRDSF